MVRVYITFIAIVLGGNIIFNKSPTYLTAWGFGLLILTPGVVSIFYVATNKNIKWSRRLKVIFNSYCIFNTFCIFGLVLVGQFFKHIPYVQLSTTILLIFPAIENLKIGVAWQKFQLEDHTVLVTFFEKKGKWISKSYMMVFATNAYITKNIRHSYEYKDAIKFWGPYKHARAYIFALLNNLGI